ncbi:MAG: DNA repair protein RecO [Microgenomates group bacterium]
MRPKRYSSEAIVLARKNYSEADRIIVVYSRNYGKLHLLAKGVRKLESRKRGSLEIFNHFRFSAARGRNLDIMTETEIINSFPQIRNDLKRVSVAYYLVEVVGRITKEEEKNEELFNLLLKTLKKIKTTKALRKLRKDFVYNILVLLGFWPKGKVLDNHDIVLEEVLELNINSVRVGKKLLS